MSFFTQPHFLLAQFPVHEHPFSLDFIVCVELRLAFAGVTVIVARRTLAVDTFPTEFSSSTFFRNVSFSILSKRNSSRNLAISISLGSSTFCSAPLCESSPWL